MTGKYRDSIMKKHLLLFAVLSTVFTVIACNALIETELEQTQEEEVTPPAPEVKLVPKTFTASCLPDDEDTKTILNGLNIEWKARDKVAVFDNLNPSIIHEFEATTDGPVTTLSGTVTENSKQFCAVYPYSAAVSCSFPAEDFVGDIVVTLPNEQRPVADSFDPSAAVVVAYAGGSTDDLNFKIPFTVVKFSVGYDDVYSVSLSSDIDMSGGMRTRFETGTFNMRVGGTGTKYQSVTVKNADNTPLIKDATYYAILRYGTHTSFTATLGNTSPAYAKRVAGKDLELVKARVYNLGKFSDANVNFNLANRYQAYQDGFEVTIAGNVYNKADDGDATLLSDGGTFASSSGGMFFVEPGASITNSAEATITGNVVIASSEPSSPGTYTGTSGKSVVLKSGSLVMDNLIVDLSAITSGQFMTKKDNEGNFTSLTLFQCDFKGIRRYVFTPNSSYLNYGIQTINVNGCRFAVSAATQLMTINSGAKTLAGYGLFSFTNNVVYSNTGSALQVPVFLTTATIDSESNAQQDLVMNNNLFYNVAASTGLFRTYYVKSANINNNILWAKEGTSSDIYLFRLNLTTASASKVFEGASSYNYCYGALSGTWSMAPSSYIGPLSEVVNLTSSGPDPVSSFNTSTGEFELIPAYASYGPQLQPN